MIGSQYHEIWKVIFLAWRTQMWVFQKWPPVQAIFPTPKINIQNPGSSTPFSTGRSLRSWLPSVTPEPPCLGRIIPSWREGARGLHDHGNLVSSLKDPQGPLDLARKIKASSPGNQKIFRSSLDGTESVGPAAETFPKQAKGGIVFITPPSLSPHLPSEAGPILQIPSTTSWKAVPTFHSVNPPPKTAASPHQTGFHQVTSQWPWPPPFRCSSHEAAWDQRRFFWRKNQGFWGSKISTKLRFWWPKIWTIFLGWLLNHPLKNPCI